MIAVSLIVLSMFLPYYSGFSYEKVNSSSISFEDIGYDTIWKGFQSSFAWFNCLPAVLFVLVYLLKKRGVILLVTVSIVYGLFLILLILANLLTFGTVPHGNSPEYGFFVTLLGTAILFIQAVVKIARWKPLSGAKDGIQRDLLDS